MIPIYRCKEKKRDSNNAIKQYILEDIHTHQTYTVNNQYDTICRPLCGQTQAFWSADKRNGGGAVENRTA